MAWWGLWQQDYFRLIFVSFVEYTVFAPPLTSKVCYPEPASFKEEVSRWQCSSVLKVWQEIKVIGIKVSLSSFWRLNVMLHLLYCIWSDFKIPHLWWRWNKEKCKALLFMSSLSEAWYNILLAFWHSVHISFLFTPLDPRQVCSTLTEGLKFCIFQHSLDVIS